MNVFELNRLIWKPRRADLAQLLEYNRILARQSEEARESLEQGDIEHATLEWADSLTLSGELIEMGGFDPEERAIYRLLTRHMGQTAEITAKYERLDSEYPL